jgi:hypothetical protein
MGRGGSAIDLGSGGCLFVPVAFAAAIAGMGELSDTDYTDAAAGSGIALILPPILSWGLLLLGFDTADLSFALSFILWLAASLTLATLAWKYACRRSWRQCNVAALVTMVPLFLVGLIVQALRGFATT